MSNHRMALCCACIAVTQFASSAHAGATLHISDDASATFGALLQPRLDFAQEVPGKPSGGLLYNPYLRRVRLILSGQVGPRVSFFVDTDSPNLGEFNDWTPRVYVQDAFANFDIHEALQIVTGLFFLPFSHQGTQGGTFLLGVDYGASLMLEPAVTAQTGSPIASNLVWRDVGAMVRGRFLDGMFEYRAAATAGIMQFAGNVDVNARALPRLTGRLVFNFFDAEGASDASGVFYAGVNLVDEGDKLISPKKILSVGGSASWQYNAAQGTTGPASYQGYDADLFFDLPVGDATQALTGQVDFYSYNQGDGNPTTGRGIFAEVGYRIDRWEPLAAVEWFASTREDNVGNKLYWRVGLNYWLYGHSASIKIDAGATQTTSATSNPRLFSGRVQTQLLF